MTAPLPPYWVIAEHGNTVTVAVELADFSTAQITVARRLLGTAVGDSMIRGVIERRNADMAAVKDGGPA